MKQYKRQLFSVVYELQRLNSSRKGTAFYTHLHKKGKTIVTQGTALTLI